MPGSTIHSTYVVAAGSNRRGRHGSPRAEVAAALDRLGGLSSRIVASAPMGPSIRTFANAVALVRTDRAPDAMLAWLKDIEREFGRRRGQRWGARVIDLDIVLWSGGMWVSDGLAVPHLAFRERAFVLAPLVELAHAWRDPVTGRRVRHLLAQETRRRRLPRHVGP